jgi:hypothetical protein
MKWSGLAKKRKYAYIEILIPNISLGLLSLMEAAILGDSAPNH